MFNEIYNKIKEFDTIIIHRHSNPDGDAWGSQIGLRESLKCSFPSKHIYTVGDYSERYAFIGDLDIISDDIYNDALVIVLDCGSANLISDERYKTGKYIIKIDHHIPVENYGDLNYVDTNRESCAGVITELIMNTPLLLNSFSASALFTGIITDSGRFRYNSTTSKSFECASFLLKESFDMQKIYNKLYVEDLEKIKLKAYLTTKFEITDCNVAYLINTLEEVKSYNMDPFSVSRGMVGIMAGIKGIDAWANFTEDVDGSIMVELRSSGLNINQVAVKYGGGGHLAASGCKLDNPSKIKDVLNDLDKVVKGEYNG